MLGWSGGAVKGKYVLVGDDKDYMLCKKQDKWWVSRWAFGDVEQVILPSDQGPFDTLEAAKIAYLMLVK